MTLTDDDSLPSVWLVVVLFVGLFVLANRKDTIALIRELRRTTWRERWSVAWKLALVLLIAMFLPWGRL